MNISELQLFTGSINLLTGFYSEVSINQKYILINTIKLPSFPKEGKSRSSGTGWFDLLFLKHKTFTTLSQCFPY